MSNATRYIPLSCKIRLLEDDYREGELLETARTWDADIELRGNKTTASSILEILKAVPYIEFNPGTTDPLKLFENDPIGEGDYSRFDADIMVKAFGDLIGAPTPGEIERWKKGEETLHAMHIILRIAKAGDLSKEDVEVFC